MVTPMDNKRKIGILGGTFNPIHIGHLLLAEQALETFHLDQVLIMPSGQSYMKNEADIVPKEHRNNMVQLAISDNPSFSLSTIETEREGNTYTFETLLYLRKQLPNAEFYFILGADNLFTIEKWKEVSVIFQNCTLIASVRGDKDFTEIKNKAEELKVKYGAKILLLPERLFTVSSTEIREKIAKGQSVQYLTPNSVIAYINEHDLYRNPADF